MNRLFINTRESEKRWMVEKSGEMVELFIEQPEHASLIGNIYLGVVEKVIPSMNAAFVHIGKGKKGYLHISQIPAYYMSEEANKPFKSIAKFLRQGEKIIVQVVKDETDSKYYRLTGNIEFSGKAIVYMPFGKYTAVSKKLNEETRTKWKEWAKLVLTDSEGIVIRTSVENVTNDVLLQELEKLRKQFTEVHSSSVKGNAPSLLLQKNTFYEKISHILEKEQMDEIYCDEISLFQKLKEALKDSNLSINYYPGNENIISHFQTSHAMEQLTKKIVWLKNGANIVIEETEACTVIDVNTGKFTGKSQKEKTIFDTNLLAAEEIARQVKLRNIAGIILVDFINMKSPQQQKQIISLLNERFIHDQERVTIYGFTSLGILELSRKRTTPSIKQKLTISCPVCNGLGTVMSPATIAFQLERELWEYKGSDYSEVQIEATPDVIQYFTGENEAHLHDLEVILRIKILLQSIDKNIPHYHIKRWR
ncbi:Rne/Rng family ribonuclease [Caldibacillus lycopersici]|uniref:Ribonuclease G n=1 Tax=Perspicuibacillus lycopersici TaxID=1325689 RepID=A0AAE3LQZ2_9BACI|nr:Rne/Rng family ribonuclease [Perspicuibacillus lycopersici]MCU9614004.1 Rne/Rng family ribonuclease [Perspicuibacillus lycopersici]